MISPEEDAAKLDDGKNTVLEKDAAGRRLSDMYLPNMWGVLYVLIVEEERGAHTWSI